MFRTPIAHGIQASQGMLLAVLTDHGQDSPLTRCICAQSGVRLTGRGIFFFNDTATTEIYTLSLHDALPISACGNSAASSTPRPAPCSPPAWTPSPKPPSPATTATPPNGATTP